MELCQQMHVNYLMVNHFGIVTETWFLHFMCCTKLKKEIISVCNCQIRCYLVCINKVVHKWELIYSRVCSFHFIMSFFYNQCLKHLMFHIIKQKCFAKNKIDTKFISALNLQDIWKCSSKFEFLYLTQLSDIWLAWDKLAFIRRYRSLLMRGTKVGGIDFGYCVCFLQGLQWIGFLSWQSRCWISTCSTSSSLKKVA